MKILLNGFFILGLRGANSETSKHQPLALFMHFVPTSGMDFVKIQKNYQITNLQTYKPVYCDVFKLIMQVLR